MGREPQEQKCGDYRYRVMPMPPKKALRLLGKIGRLVGPAMGHMVDGVMQSSSSFSELLNMDTSELTELSFGRVAKELFDRWDNLAVEEVMDELAAVTFFNTGAGTDNAWPLLKDQFDTHFQGNLSGLVKWLKFALGVQYGDFFVGSGQLMGFLAQNQSPNTVSQSQMS